MYIIWLDASSYTEFNKEKVYYNVSVLKEKKKKKKGDVNNILSIHGTVLIGTVYAG